MSLMIQIGLDAITSYKRLAYTPWHAIAEFIDNSTQAYFDNKEVLDKAYQTEGEKLYVSVAYDKDSGLLRISDNSIGMSYEELENALHVALPPKNTNGRSKYGMGMKTAACWIGNKWSIRTKKLGETVEHLVKINVETIAAGNQDLHYESFKGKAKEAHYTVIEIKDHNRKFHGRTIGKIRDFLRSMFREDFRSGIMVLDWQGSPLTWEDIDSRLLKAHDGTLYKKAFSFAINGKKAYGWVGILDRGSRADAGFSIIHCGRVVRGWPDSWRPTSLYGQIQGSNDLVNQRLIGEIHLDDFDVSHTKDDILWLGNEEEKVEEGLREYCGDYREVALKRRKGTEDERGPSDTEIDVAVDELKRELTSPEMVDRLSIIEVPPEEVIAEALKKITSVVIRRDATFHAEVSDLKIKGYIESDMSPYDPYVIVDSTSRAELIIIVNTSHPHWNQLKGSDGVLNYLRHCTYDAIAEWQARQKAARIDPDTIKILKDALLRVPFEIEMHSGQDENNGS